MATLRDPSRLCAAAAQPALRCGSDRPIVGRAAARARAGPPADRRSRADRDRDDARARAQRHPPGSRLRGHGQRRRRGLLPGGDDLPRPRGRLHGPDLHAPVPIPREPAPPHPPLGRMAAAHEPGGHLRARGPGGLARLRPRHVGPAACARAGRRGGDGPVRVVARELPAPEPPRRGPRGAHGLGARAVRARAGLLAPGRAGLDARRVRGAAQRGDLDQADGGRGGRRGGSLDPRRGGARRGRVAARARLLRGSGRAQPGRARAAEPGDRRLGVRLRLRAGGRAPEVRRLLALVPRVHALRGPGAGLPGRAGGRHGGAGALVALPGRRLARRAPDRGRSGARPLARRAAGQRPRACSWSWPHPPSCTSG